MENNAPEPKPARHYQTRRNKEIRQREARREEREQARRESQQQTQPRTSDFDFYEDVVPVPEPNRIVRYWRISRLRQEWPTLYKRLGYQKNELEHFIATRRRPAIRPSEKPCPLPKYPSWYLGGASGLE
jgi:hypothetical protein